MLFQSSPGVVAGCDSSSRPSAGRSPLFQSSPGVVAGCDLPCLCHRPGRGNVSILTRRGGRVRPSARSRSPRPRWCFNPHPAWWPGATAERRHRHVHHVEFQSSPGVVAGCDDCTSALCFEASSFQSSPGVVAGCDMSWRVCIATHTTCFNPHPAWWPGATTRWSRGYVPHWMFQSSPGVVAGCDAWLMPAFAASPLFQSSPGVVAGCDRRATSHTPGSAARFNPHPAWWPGATRLSESARLS